ncbi:hypothetical protein [Pedobacter sp. B4-66]|uniref:hypothetical protein n=1 Tax=Pedobacter sp. B4-66 TaxID=2817280 RepID=UPI001BDA5FA0|nr:hypothetical protein [Pedobacter sp. B4-66]
MLNILHNYYADNQLKIYGTNANAIVTSVQYMSGYKSYPGIIIKFTYTSRGRIYNHSIMDDVEVKCSSMDPDLFEEVGNWILS